MQDEKHSKTLSVIVTLSVIIGALVSAAAVLYYFREKLGLDKLWDKIRRVSKKTEDCCYICDEDDETYSNDVIQAAE